MRTAVSMLGLGVCRRQVAHRAAAAQNTSLLHIALSSLHYMLSAHQEQLLAWLAYKFQACAEGCGVVRLSVTLHWYASVQQLLQDGT
jgi:hypothetical protein